VIYGPALRPAILWAGQSSCSGGWSFAREFFGGLEKGDFVNIPLSKCGDRGLYASAVCGKVRNGLRTNLGIV